MAEGLGRFIKFQVAQAIIQGWKWHNDIPAYTDLQFVDDTRLMGLATINEARNLRWILDTYLKAPRQQINEGKSSIHFFNTPQSIQLRIARILRFQVRALPLIYLGVPLALGTQLKEY